MDGQFCTCNMTVEPHEMIGLRAGWDLRDEGGAVEEKRPLPGDTVFSSDTGLCTCRVYK